MTEYRLPLSASTKSPRPSPPHNLPVGFGVYSIVACVRMPWSGNAASCLPAKSPVSD
jgi:hypothetical protein